MNWRIFLKGFMNIQKKIPKLNTPFDHSKLFAVYLQLLFIFVFEHLILFSFVPWKWRREVAETSGDYIACFYLSMYY